MIIIGERVNATRKMIKSAVEQKNRDVIISEITLQDRYGADFIDLNAGTGSGTVQQEQDDLRWLIDIALACTDKHLVLDAASPEILSSAAEHLENRRPWMLNSINGELSAAELEIIDLAASFQVPLIALAMDSDGIPATVEKRLAICETIMQECGFRGLGEEKVFFDPLVLPISTDHTQAMVTFRTIAKIKERFPKANTTLGLSNVSHGLKKRALVNGSFLTTAACFGLDSAICDPSRKSIRRAIVTGDLLGGRDRFCRKFSRSLRQGLFDEENKKS